MAALVCDICGGKLKVTDGKMAICESCGMVHTIERVRQKYRESQNIVHVDNAHLIDNYYSMAQDAYDAENKQEAENYCNRIIEIDSEFSEAFLLKGRAVGWQSTLDNFRFKEAAICFAKAVDSAVTKAEKDELHEKIEDEFKGLATALIKLRCDRFSKWPDSDEARGFKRDLDEIAQAIEVYTDQVGIDVNKNKVFSNVSSIVQMCMTVVSATVLFEYRLSGTRRAYSEFDEKTEHCVDIMKKTIDLCDDDDKSDIALYEQSIKMLRAVLDNNCTDQLENRWGAYVETSRLTDYDKIYKQKKIAEYENLIKKLRQNIGGM